MCDEGDREKRQIVIFGDYEIKKIKRKWVAVKHDDEVKIHGYNYDDMETFPQEGELPIVKVFCNGNTMEEIVGALEMMIVKIRNEYQNESVLFRHT